VILMALAGRGRAADGAPVGPWLARRYGFPYARSRRAMSIFFI